MGALSFLSPIMLSGMALASVPIIIHLLFRRRFRRIDWAPMKYLKLTAQHNRRRIHLEQLLLLLVRVAAVLLLFFLIARPVLNAQGFVGLLGARSRASHVLVLDDSLSMGYHDGQRSAMTRGKEVVGQLIDAIGSRNLLTLVLTSQPSAPVLREVEITDQNELDRFLDEITPTETYSSWPATLKAVDELLKTGTYPIQDVTIVTDLRRAGWDDTVSEVAQSWAAANVRVRLYDVGTDATANVSLLSFEAQDRVSLVGVSTRIEAAIRNDGRTGLAGAEATFVVDGNPSAVALPQIAPGATIRLPLTATFQSAGPHWMSLQLPGDPLPGDDVRWHTRRVRRQLRLLLVDGEPSAEPFGGEVEFLALALAVGVAEADAWLVEVITDAQWLAASSGNPDLLVLANVADLTSEKAAEIRNLVRDGMGLIVFVGDQIDPDIYNQLLFDDGAGPLPGQLEAIEDEKVTGLLLEPIEHSPLQSLSQLKPAVLQRISSDRFMRVRVSNPPPAGSRVVARWNNAEGSPAALDKEYGEGRVLLWTTCADKQWGDWPIAEHSYVLAMRESSMAVARADFTVEPSAGEPIRYRIPVSDVVSNPMVNAPGTEAPQPMTTESATDDTSESRSTDESSETSSSPGTPAYRFLSTAATSRAGVYTVRWRDATDTQQEDVVAVNPQRIESELARIRAERLHELFRGLDIDIIHAASDPGRPLTVGGQEIWRVLAAALLCLLMGESALAMYAGRQR